MLTPVYAHHDTRTVPITTSTQQELTLVCPWQQDCRGEGRTLNTDKVDGAADERDIWEVAHVTEEDFETTEGEAQDLYDKLMEMGGWTPTVPETLRKRMT